MEERGGQFAPQSGAERLFQLNYQEIWASIYRSRIAITVIIGCCIAFAIIITVLTTPVYEATATIQIDQEAKKVLGTEQDNAASAGALDSQRFINTQLQILRSQSVAAMVAQELRLFNNPQFLETMGTDVDTSLESGPNVRDANRQAVLSVLSENLVVGIESDSRIAEIRFASPDASLAASVSNSFAENFIRNNLKLKFDTSTYARDFLRKQLEQAQQKLELAERALVQFSTNTQIIDASNTASTSSDAPRSLLIASLVEANDNLSQTVARRIEAQKRWEQAQRVSVLSLPEVLSNPAIQQLYQQRATAQADYEEQLQRRKDDFPQVRQARAKVEEIDTQLESLASGIRRSIQNQYLIYADQERAIKARLANLRSETLDEQRRGVQLTILRREAATASQQYETLLRRFNQLTAEAGVQSNNIAIIDRAVVPSDPAWPKIPLNMALALVAGLLASIGYVFAREQLFDRLRSPEDIVQRLGLPLLGTVPEAGADGTEELKDPKTDLSEAFSSIRTSLTLLSSKGLPRTMTFISTAKGEGKSTACFATATGLGKLGKRVLVLDLDLRLPTQHKLYDVANKRGMSDILAGDLDVDSAVIKTSYANVSLIPSGPIAPSPSELLTGERLRGLMQKLLESYDVVLVDSPPVLGLADALLIGSCVEATIYVVRTGTHSTRNVQVALRRLSQAGVFVAGAILTRYDSGRAGYGYSTNYSYNYSS